MYEMVSMSTVDIEEMSEIECQIAGVVSAVTASLYQAGMTIVTTTADEELAIARYRRMLRQTLARAVDVPAALKSRAASQYSAFRPTSENFISALAANISAYIQSDDGRAAAHEGLGTTIEQQVRSDPSTSFWLKAQLDATTKRDMVDALDDARALVAVLQERLDRAAGSSVARLKKDRLSNPFHSS